MLLSITDSFQNNERPKTIFIMKQDIRRYIYMLRIACQAGPIGLKFFCGHLGVAGDVVG